MVNSQKRREGRMSPVSVAMAHRNTAVLARNLLSVL